MRTVLGFVPFPAEVSGPPRFVPVGLQHSVVVVGLHLAVEVSGIAVTRGVCRGADHGAATRFNEINGQAQLAGEIGKFRCIPPMSGCHLRHGWMLGSRHRMIITHPDGIAEFEPRLHGGVEHVGAAEHIVGQVSLIQ